LGTRTAEKPAQLRIGRLTLDKGVKASAGSPVGEGDHRNIPNLRMFFKPRGNRWRFCNEPHAAAFAISNVQSSRNRVIDFFAGGHPDAVHQALAGKHPAFSRGKRIRGIFALMLQQMTEIVVAGRTKHSVPAAVVSRELKVGDISAAAGAVPGVKPVLLFGEIVVRYTGMMQRSQHRFCRLKIRDIAKRLGDVQRDTVEPATYQSVVAAE